MITKKILSLVASIIKLFIIFVFFSINSNAEQNNSKYYFNDLGTLALMFHRFNENKYPSTNIRNEIFIEQLKEIEKLKMEFITFNKFEKIVKSNIDKNYLLLTIDDAFESFYLNAWPMLKQKKIPFILFVSTREIGKYGYMTWEEIKEVASYEFVTIGNHSHSHEYLIDWDEKKITTDIKTSINILKKKIRLFSKNFFISLWRI